jgi:hypothetical protein
MAVQVMTSSPLPSRYGGPAGHTASHILRSLAARKSETISFGDMMATAGARVHGLGLLLIVLPETLPLPLPSASTVLAIPLLLISLHLAISGEGSRWPKRLDTFHVPRSVVASVVRYIAPVLEWLESMSRPRWTAFAEQERLIGVVCAYLSLILLLPLPFVNAPPAICLALIALGLIQRDGILIALGLAGTVITTFALVAAMVWAGSFVFGFGTSET